MLETNKKEVIFNPVTGEKLVILESNEEVFRFAFSITPRSEIAGEHIHPFQEQRIRAVSGKLCCRINGKERVLRPGELAIVPPGAPHFQWNPTDTEATAIEEHRPARQIHNFFRVLFALAREGKTDKRGIPKPLIGAALMAEFSDTVRPDSSKLQILFKVLSPVSTLLGYRQTIRNYTEKFGSADSRIAINNQNLRLAKNR